MDTLKRFNMLTELLSKFKNGDKLYRESVMFNQALQMMADGMSVYEVLEGVIIVADRTQQALNDHLNRYGYNMQYFDRRHKEIVSRTNTNDYSETTWTPDPEALERFKNTYINDLNKND